MGYLDIFFDFRVTGVFIGLLIPVYLYWYLTKDFNYWKKRGVPYVKPYPLIGSMGEMFTKKLEDIELDRYKKFGRLYGLFEGSKPILVIGEPELIRSILVKDFQYFSSRRVMETGDPLFDSMLSVINGEDWKRLRTIVSPTFSTGKIKRLMNIFKDCSKIVLENMKLTANTNYVLDVVKIYGGYTMDVIASSAFSTKLDSHRNPENEFVKHAKEAFTQTFSLRFLIFICAPRLVKKLKIQVFDPKSMDFFKKATLDIIEERKRTGQVRNDFLQLLLDAVSEVSKEEKLDDKTNDIVTNCGADSSNHNFFNTATSKTISMDELVAQCIIFFIGGYHTTATTLGLVTYFLAINQDMQKKFFNEIKEVLHESAGELTYEAVQKMKYLDDIISETLRLYPPVIRLDRTAESNYKLGNTGLTIPKGMMVSIPNFAIHRDPEFFPEPEKFNPDRFSPEEREKQVPYTFIPFGAGPRNCVGMRFALIEIKVCIVHIFSVFHVKRCSETKVPLEFDQTAGVLSPKSIILLTEPREDCPLKL